MMFCRFPEVNRLLIGIFKYLSQKDRFFHLPLLGFLWLVVVPISCHSSFALVWPLNVKLIN